MDAHVAFTRSCARSLSRRCVHLGRQVVIIIILYIYLFVGKPFIMDHTLRSIICTTVAWLQWKYKAICHWSIWVQWHLHGEFNWLIHELCIGSCYFHLGNSDYSLVALAEVTFGANAGSVWRMVNSLSFRTTHDEILHEILISGDILTGFPSVCIL